MLFGIDWGYAVRMIPKLISTVPYTFFIIALSGVLGLTLAMGVAVVRVKKWKLIYPLITIYVSFFRSTPPLIHIFLVYYGLPLALRHIGINGDQWSRTVYVSLALVLFNGAHMSEFLRPAYLSVDKGQLDAADSIGMTGLMKFRRVILPQMLPVAWPNISNAMVELAKDTSVLFVIGLVDIMGKVKMFIHNDFGIKKLEVYIAAAVIYWGLTFGITKGFEFFEDKKMARGHPG